MDLIYMNENREDIGVLQSFELDMAYGADENNFECRIASNQHCCSAGYYLYVENTAFGGIIDAIESDTANSEIVYSGRTWHGILGSKVILPLQAGDVSTPVVTIQTTDSQGNSLIGRYLIISGDANDCIRFLIERLGLSELFTVVSSTAGAYINEFQFERYQNGYSGIVKMLKSVGMKLKVEFIRNRVVLSAISNEKDTQNDEFNSDHVNFTLQKKYRTVNHLICLGYGELENRVVLHLYADENGKIGYTQSLFGMDEYAKTYDYPSAESAEDLVESGTKELERLMESTKLTVDCDESSNAYDVGDLVSATDEVTGMTVQSTVTKKIVTIKDGLTTIEYKVGE